MLSRTIERGLAAGLLGLLGFACALVLWPFLSAILWAVILTYTAWPLFELVRERLRLGASWSATVLVLTALVVLVAPIAFIVSSTGKDIAQGVRSLLAAIDAGLPPAPDWLSGLPVIGPSLIAQWNLVAEGTAGLEQVLKPYLDIITRWAVSGGLGLAQGVLDLLVSLVIAFFLFRDGEALSRRLEAGLHRLLGTRALDMLEVAGHTVRSVVYGLVGTGIAQGIIAMIGFWIAGVPGAIFWGVVTGLVSLIPGGPPFIWGGITIWLFGDGQTGWGIFMLLWGLIMVSSTDNVIRPWLIARAGGGRTPILVILLGVLGGVLAFGFLGLFLGPTLLAVAYALIAEWTAHQHDPAPPRPPALV